MRVVRSGIAIFFLSVCCSSQCLATYVVGVRTTNAIVIGADSKAGPGSKPNRCKIGKTNDVVWAHAGIVEESFTNFSLDDEARKYMSMQGTLLDRVQQFEASVFFKLGSVIDVMKNTSPEYVEEKVYGQRIAGSILPPKMVVNCG